MRATFTVEFKGDHLEVHSDGDKDLEHSRRMWTEIIATCRKHNCYRILGIAKTTTPPTVTNGYDHAELLQELGFEPQSRVAWVEPEPKAFEIVKFIETVLFNRSIGAVKVFRDESAAREWLFSNRGV